MASSSSVVRKLRVMTAVRTVMSAMSVVEIAVVSAASSVLLLRKRPKCTPVASTILDVILGVMLTHRART